MKAQGINPTESCPRDELVDAYAVLKPSSGDHSKTVSVVIRAVGEAPRLPQLVRSLLEQPSPPSEVIIVDNGLTHKTAAQVTSDKTRFVKYDRERFNYSHALNIGIRAATSPMIAVMSSHIALPYKNTLPILASLADNDGVCGASAICRMTGSNHTSPVGMTYRGFPVFEVVDLPAFNGYNGLGNPCSCFRRQLWEQLPFDITIPTAEDNLWALRHMANGLVSIRVKDPYYLYWSGNSTCHKTMRERAVVAEYLYPLERRPRYVVGAARRSLTSLLCGQFAQAKWYAMAALAGGPLRRRLIEDARRRTEINADYL